MLIYFTQNNTQNLNKDYLSRNKNKYDVLYEKKNDKLSIIKYTKIIKADVGG